MPLSVLIPAIATGIGATLLMDGWTVLRRHLLGVPSLDYALVGRWVGHMPRGRFRHVAIGKAAPVAGERPLGWAIHYLTGIVFALTLVALAGSDWLCRPTLLPALLFGVVTVAMPFLLMQPALGLGIAASRTESPAKARLHSLVTHTIFGLGLYLAALSLLPLTCAS
ncbi:DUF2938 domain-containing protein [Pseudomonas sp. BGr12]|uniref:DUF2938 domain-containing protein n=1 Tax=unclassified Pseudomonas TaxID=196821 RepID=UPI001784DA4F|nr:MULTISPECIES: DUF2938 domain-containing protein [unclassified Pseudomonas]MBD9500826.1 DUF2938 domain-containing protein [Pseudomonas sp. PDM17]MBD9578902.1 DUF2938 domain-containing protein [Pseudomonas sp. PDM23]MBD9674578.1 DUF2938 domain-containing protein [Pseudomonas sp. PDM21]MDL2430381.1 DUF2938 domain-containing protein [Pseudomonas sp. BJa5]